VSTIKNVTLAGLAVGNPQDLAIAETDWQGYVASGMVAVPGNPVGSLILQPPGVRCRASRSRGPSQWFGGLPAGAVTLYTSTMGPLS
jgi:hypothetical protein